MFLVVLLPWLIYAMGFFWYFCLDLMATPHISPLQALDPNTAYESPRPRTLSKKGLGPTRAVGSSNSISCLIESGIEYSHRSREQLQWSARSGRCPYSMSQQPMVSCGHPYLRGSTFYIYIYIIYTFSWYSMQLWGHMNEVIWCWMSTNGIVDTVTF